MASPHSLSSLGQTALEVAVVRAPGERTARPAVRRPVRRGVRRRSPARRGGRRAPAGRTGGAGLSGRHPHPVLRRLPARGVPRSAAARSCCWPAGLDTRAFRLPWPDGTRAVRARPPRGHRVQGTRCSPRRVPSAALRAPRAGGRPARRLARRAARRGLRARPADRLAGRGAAHLPDRRGGHRLAEHGRRACRRRAASWRPSERTSPTRRCSSRPRRSSAWTTSAPCGRAGWATTPPSGCRRTAGRFTPTTWLVAAAYGRPADEDVGGGFLTAVRPGGD